VLVCVCLFVLQVCSSMFGANAADSLDSVLCGAVQLELFLAQQQAPGSPGQAMAAAQERVSRATRHVSRGHCASYKTGNDRVHSLVRAPLRCCAVLIYTCPRQTQQLSPVCAACSPWRCVSSCPMRST
jgi:hypothetical protein